MCELQELPGQKGRNLQAYTPVVLVRCWICLLDCNLPSWLGRKGKRHRNLDHKCMGFHQSSWLGFALLPRNAEHLWEASTHLNSSWWTWRCVDTLVFRVRLIGKENFISDHEATSGGTSKLVHTSANMQAKWEYYYRDGDEILISWKETGPSRYELTL